MKLLFITSRLPYPPFGGDKLRVFNFIKYLSKGHKISLVSFIESGEELQYIVPLKEYCENIETILLRPIHSYLNCILYSLSLVPFQAVYYRDGRMRRKILDILKSERFDGIYIHLLRMAQYAKDLRNVNRVLDLTDALSLSLRRSLKFRRHVFFLFYFTEWLKVRRYEPTIIKRFNRCLLVSEVDKETTKSLQDADNLAIVSNGVDFDYFKPMTKEYNPHSIVFMGNLHSFPNRDAVFYFYREVLPLIKKEIPDIKFNIIGINPTKKILSLSKDKNIVVTGKVDDSRPYLSDAAALVCPIRVATGMQNKILEAMAMGLPVVSTSIATQWLGAKAEEGILIADTPEDFARKVIEAIRNRNLRQRLSLNARKVATENYDWNKNIEKLEVLFGEGIK